VKTTVVVVLGYEVQVNTDVVVTRGLIVRVKVVVMSVVVVTG